jgi:quercetin dioxygenase-like cupin family protein
MKLPDSEFTSLRLTDLDAKIEFGETGRSLSRTYERSGLRLRIVEYQPGYLADHWCDRGHVFHMLHGEVTVELKDGRAIALTSGQSFVVSDFGDAPHRVRSERGGAAFIVD